MNGSELLPSWSQRDAKCAVLEFVESVSRPGAFCVPPGDRIETLDNDGALWCEKQQSVQTEFTLRRWRHMVQADPAKAKGAAVQGARGERPGLAHEPARPRSGSGRPKCPHGTRLA
jgi:hypothetical protein